MDNITALDEGVYKCEITYTKVHEGCNIVQFINLTTYSKSEQYKTIRFKYRLLRNQIKHNIQSQ